MHRARSRSHLLICVASCVVLLVASCASTSWRGDAPPDLRQIDFLLLRDRQSYDIEPTRYFIDGVARVVEESRNFRISEAYFCRNAEGDPGLGFDVHPDDVDELEGWTRQNLGRLCLMSMDGESFWTGRFEVPFKDGFSIFGGSGGWSKGHVRKLIKRLNVPASAK